MRRAPATGVTDVARLRPRTAWRRPAGTRSITGSPGSSRRAKLSRSVGNAGEDAGVAEAGDDVHVLAAVLGVDDRRPGSASGRRAGRVARVDARRRRRRSAHGDGATDRRACSGAPPSDLAVARPAVVGRSQTAGCDMPMNAATYSVAGCSKTCSGVSYCSMRPLRMMARRSPRASASRLVVGDEHGGEAEPAVQLVDLGAHLVAQPGVEVAERLVEEHQVGPGDEAAGQRDALLLAAAELRRVAVEQRSAIDELRPSPRPTRRFEPVLDLAGLERVARCSCARSCAATARTTGTPCRCCACPASRLTRRRRRTPSSSPNDDRPGARRLQPGEAPQRRGLAAPARAEEDEELALLDLEVRSSTAFVGGLPSKCLVEVFEYDTWSTDFCWTDSLWTCGRVGRAGEHWPTPPTMLRLHWWKSSRHCSVYSATNSGVSCSRS